MKSTKAAGSSEITANMTASSDAGVTMVADMMATIVKEGTVQDDRLKSMFAHVYEENGGVIEHGSYSGLKLLNQIMNVAQWENNVNEKVDVDVL